MMNKFREMWQVSFKKRLFYVSVFVCDGVFHCGFNELSAQL